MGVPTYITGSSVGVSAVYSADYRQSPFNLGVAVTGSSSGTFGYTVQYTFDDQNYLTLIRSTRTPVWFNDPNLTAQTSNNSASYTSPVAALRLQSTALSSAVLTMCIIQGGPA